tara:strand:+ start:373 stop:648 length:276 start_codon:yes stop_codon:yes gene_type:complete
MLYAEGAFEDISLSHTDRDNGIDVSRYGNILVISDGSEAWLASNSLTAISKTDAQERYDAYIDEKIASYDPDPEPWRYSPERTEPVRKTLP